jgi:hypothetical protein
MLCSICGTYKNGTIELKELPLNIQESQVIVTFLDSPISKEIDSQRKWAILSELLPDASELSESDILNEISAYRQDENL